jgi:hypothetical protein
MTLPVVWLPEADAELKEARSWYNSVRVGLGERFALAVESAVESVANNPLQFPVVHKNLRRAACGDSLTEYSSSSGNRQS